jgi:hypothetical protein
MKGKGLIKIGILFCIIIFFASTASAATTPQREAGRHGLFNIQFACTVSWSGNQTQTPITPGDLRSINLEVTSSVIRGVFGGLFLKLLKGNPYLTKISVEESLEWCTAWISEEYFTQTMYPDQVSTIYVPLYIFVDENAPNHTVGTVRINIKIYDMKGPFEFFTVVEGCEQIATLAFVTGF